MNTITKITNKIKAGKELDLMEIQAITKAYEELKGLRWACVGIMPDTHEYLYLFSKVEEELMKQGMTQREATAEAYYLTQLQDLGEFEGCMRIVTKMPEGAKKLNGRPLSRFYLPGGELICSL